MLEKKYRVLFGACLVQFTTIGLLFSYGLFFKPLEAEFGWSRTLMSGAMSVATLMMGALAILAGRLNDRFGPRLVVGGAGLAYGLAFALMSQIEAPWQLFVLFGTGVALGLGAHDVVTLSTIARWFTARRGIMSGVVKSGTALGQVAVPPIAALLLVAYGWRTTLVVLGVSGMALLLIAALAMERPPAILNRAALNRTHPAPTSPDLTGTSYAQARRTRVFWSLCAIQFLFFPSMMTVPTHLPVHGSDLGMSAARAATLLSILGATSIAGRLTVGTLSDRIGGKRAFLMCFVLLVASLLGLLATTSHGLLFGVVAIYGFCHGGLFTVVSPLVAEYFGMRAHGAIFGTILFFGTLGGAMGPILAGWIFDTTGSYALAFTGLATLAAIGLVLVASLPKASKTPDTATPLG